MPHSDSEEREYDSDDVAEDAELELSCALHDLAEHVKIFEENMKTRLKINGIAIGDEDEEISEDIPEIDEDHQQSKQYGYASPKKRMRKLVKDLKQQDEDDVQDEDNDYDEDWDYKAEDAKATTRKIINNPVWNEENETEELSELKNNIAMLLRGMKEEAKALEVAQCSSNQY